MSKASSDNLFFATHILSPLAAVNSAKGLTLCRRYFKEEEDTKLACEEKTLVERISEDLRQVAGYKVIYISMMSYLFYA